WGNELPYLKSVESKWEENNPKSTEQKIFSAEEIEKKIGISLTGSTEIPIEINRTSSNRVSEIHFNEDSLKGKNIGKNSTYVRMTLQLNRRIIILFLQLKDSAMALE